MQLRVTGRIHRNRTLPENSKYYYLAYAVATGIYVGYSLLLLARWNRVNAKSASDESK